MTRTKTRALANWPNNAVSILDLGIVPSETLDQTAAIRAAVLEAGEATLYWPEGTYMFHGIADFPNKVHWVGSGNSTIFKLVGANQNDMLKFNGQKSVIIENLTIDGNFTENPAVEAGHGIRCDDTEFAIFKNLKLQNINNDGISLKIAESDSPQTGTIVEGCHFENCSRNGIAVVGGKGIQISNCYFTQCGLCNIDIEPNVQNNARGVAVTNCTGTVAPIGHVWFQYTDGCVGSNNSYICTKPASIGTNTINNGVSILPEIVDPSANFTADGVEAGDKVTISLADGTFVGTFSILTVVGPSQLQLKQCYGSEDAIVSGSTYVVNGSRGAYGIWNSTNCILTGNFGSDYVSNNYGGADFSGCGMNLTGSQYCTINGNVLTGLENSGIAVFTSRDCVINNNIIETTAANGIIDVSDGTPCSHITIADNNITSTGPIIANFVGSNPIASSNQTGYVRAYLSGNLNVPQSNDDYLIAWNVAQGTDQPNLLSGGKYTVPYSGVYEVDVTLTLQSYTPNQTFVGRIRVDGVLVQYADMIAASAGLQQLFTFRWNNFVAAGSEIYVELKNPDGVITVVGGTVHSSATFKRMFNG